MLKVQDIAIVSGTRTPMGRYCGKSRDFTVQELGALATKAAIERADVAFVVGTHALIQQEVRAPRMGLGVVDEQPGARRREVGDRGRDPGWAGRRERDGHGEIIVAISRLAMP